MGFYSTTLEQEKPHQKTSDCAQKTASGIFFASNRNRTYQIERNPLETQQEKLTTTTETASGVFLYKYRHYSAELGRWLGRDPIEEDGGVNLYAFVGNGPTYYWDYLGLECCLATITEQGGELTKQYQELLANAQAIQLRAKARNVLNSGCYELANLVLEYLTPTPECWTCKTVSYQTARYMFGSQHAWVRCESVDPVDVGDKQILNFDLWQQLPDGTEDPEDDYPYIEVDFPQETASSLSDPHMQALKAVRPDAAALKRPVTNPFHDPTEWPTRQPW